VDWKLPPLPYPKHALEPYVSARTLGYHHGKHHAGYLATLRDEIEGTALGESSLEELVLHTRGKLFNPAAQAWNHDFYWQCMSPDGGGRPPAAVRSALEEAFGSMDEFTALLTSAAVDHFGSGWAWLFRHGEDDRLVVASTSDAETPFAVGHVPVLTIDVWEHAYYLDYQHERQRYVEAFMEHLVNWEFVRRNLARRDDAHARPPAH
jgi:Fe-Mn family superoxide dismutase